MEEVLAIIRYSALEVYDEVVGLISEGKLALELLEKPQTVVARACDASGAVVSAQAPSKREAVRRLFEMNPAFLR